MTVHATIVQALPGSFAIAEKSNFCVNASLLAMWFCIPEVKNIFQWHFAGIKSVTCALSAIFKAESQKDSPELASRLLFSSDRNCKGHWVMSSRFSHEYAFEWSNLFPTHAHFVTCFVIIQEHDTPHQSCHPMEAEEPCLVGHICTWAVHPCLRARVQEGAVGTLTFRGHSVHAVMNFEMITLSTSCVEADPDPKLYLTFMCLNILPHAAVLSPVPCSTPLCCLCSVVAHNARCQGQT